MHRSARLAMDVLLALVRQVETGPIRRSDQLVARAQRMLRDGVAGASCVKSVARELGVTREHLTRAFREAGQRSPAAWQRAQRMRLAETLLQNTDLTVAEIAAQCGFCSSSHFSQTMETSRRR